MNCWVLVDWPLAGAPGTGPGIAGTAGVGAQSPGFAEGDNRALFFFCDLFFGQA
jgi:hypothetical protein